MNADPSAFMDHSPGEIADALERLVGYLRRYVAFPSEHEAVAIALWVAHAWVVETFETSPILAITSAEMRSGKTRLLDCLELLVPAPFRVVLPSEAVTYTVLSRRPRPTLLLDEADAIFGPRTAERYEGLRAILNSGNRRGSPVLRVKLVGSSRTVEEFDVFGPKAVAGIGSLPSTVADRSISIRLKRRGPAESVAKFRRKAAEREARELDFDWRGVQFGTDASVPDELNDRAADSWEPLLAIGDAAGGPWPALGRSAAVALSTEEVDVSVGMRLLADIRDVFGDDDHLQTRDLLQRLCDLDEAPWGDWYGKQLSARWLAKLLEPYQVRPSKQRVGGPSKRGYFRADFKDAWQRYCPQETATNATNATPVAGSPSEVADVADVAGPE